MQEINIGWINVVHQLPKYNERVLVTDGNEVTVGYCDFGDFVGMECPIKKITHWMDLPNPPYV